MNNSEITWDMVPEIEIDRELAYWTRKGATRVWLVPSQYSDGVITCSGSVNMPYSNVLRREYVLETKWKQVTWQE